MTAFWVSLFIVFVAELGDKTQLVAMAFAARYSAKVVLAAVFVATLLVHLFSVFLGEAASRVVPVFWIQVLAGLSFIGFGLWTLRGDELSEEETRKPARFGPFLTVGVTFFLAELGDKTMLTTISIATQYDSFVGVWLGSSIGMVLADGAAIAVVLLLGKKLPERAIKIGAAAIFFVSGAFTLWHALR
jgi:putative Ca2+/H+ antiporter (TMEM165/GDT1 family)